MLITFQFFFIGITGIGTNEDVHRFRLSDLVLVICFDNRFWSSCSDVIVLCVRHCSRASHPFFTVNPQVFCSGPTEIFF